MPPIKHGATVRAIGATPEYRTWSAMKTRCLNPRNHAYLNYGGRGIALCDRWREFRNFLADMGPRPSLAHSIDRIDNDGPYSRENCRWATKSEQARNRHKGQRLIIGAESLMLTEWSERSGVPLRTIDDRLRYGWKPERAVFEPVASVKARRQAQSALEWSATEERGIAKRLLDSERQKARQ